MNRYCVSMILTGIVMTIAGGYSFEFGLSNIHIYNHLSVMAALSGGVGVIIGLSIVGESLTLMRKKGCLNE